MLKKFFFFAMLCVGAALQAATLQLPSDAREIRTDTKNPEPLFRWYRGADDMRYLVYNGKKAATVFSSAMAVNQIVSPGRELMVVKAQDWSKGKVKAETSMKVISLIDGFGGAKMLAPGDVVGCFMPVEIACDAVNETVASDKKLNQTWGETFRGLWQTTGICDIIGQTRSNFSSTWILGLGRVLMIAVALLLIYLAVAKGFEPLLLLPIGFGALLANIPLAGISGPDGLQGMVYNVGIESGVFPLLIFLGVGAMTDFGPLIANPKTALLGGAAQFGIFTALLGALALSACVPGISFDLKDAASIGIIGGADGPTSIWLTSKLSPKLLGAIAVAAYSYMALVPIIQPPIMKLLTTEAERKIKMKQLRPVSKVEKICFPILITLLCAFLLPDAAPLIGMLMFGNLLRECGVTERLNQTAQNALMNTVTIFLGIAVGSKLSADQFLSLQTLGILLMGCVAFCVGTAAGVLFAKIMNCFSKNKINPLIGSAGVSAVPMAARVANKVGLEADPSNYLLMHAMGPNVAGVIGSAVAAGVLLNMLKSLI
ncbi:MAG: sodium ion-translocating decarboxylase subunit beta [Victivallaceae bacterium]|nr:sodium ion-translocating decarboxylase subunit beta [Victivallaceae bacterium]